MTAVAGLKTSLAAKLDALKQAQETLLIHATVLARSPSKDARTRFDDAIVAHSDALHRLVGLYDR